MLTFEYKLSGSQAGDGQVRAESAVQLQTDKAAAFLSALGVVVNHVGAKKHRTLEQGFSMERFSSDKVYAIGLKAAFAAAEARLRGESSLSLDFSLPDATLLLASLTTYKEDRANDEAPWSRAPQRPPTEEDTVTIAAITEQLEAALDPSQKLYGPNLAAITNFVELRRELGILAAR